MSAFDGSNIPNTPDSVPGEEWWSHQDHSYIQPFVLVPSLPSNLTAPISRIYVPPQEQTGIVLTAVPTSAPPAVSTNPSRLIEDFSHPLLKRYNGQS